MALTFTVFQNNPSRTKQKKRVKNDLEILMKHHRHIVISKFSQRNPPPPKEFPSVRIVVQHYITSLTRSALPGSPIPLQVSQC